MSLYPREGTPKAKAIGLLRNVDERGVMLEEREESSPSTPGRLVFTTRAGDPEEKPAAAELDEQLEEQPRARRPRARSTPVTSGWGGWYPRTQLQRILAPNPGNFCRIPPVP